jgi:hypothetical protein
MKFFCSAEENCTVDVAMGHVKHDYLFVGVNDHISKAFQVWEKHVPLLANLSYVAASRMEKTFKRVTSFKNDMTHTSRPGALSSEMRKVLAEYTKANKDEIRFFELVMEWMWWKYFQDFPPVTPS